MSGIKSFEHDIARACLFLFLLYGFLLGVVLKLLNPKPSSLNPLTFRRKPFPQGFFRARGVHGRFGFGASGLRLQNSGAEKKASPTS